MLADLVTGPLKGRAFRFHPAEPNSGKRSVQTVPADAGEKLKHAIAAAAEVTAP